MKQSFEVVTMLSLTRETRRLSRIRVPFFFTFVGVSILVHIDNCIRSIEWIELEVVFPSRCHVIVVVILVEHFWTIYKPLPFRIIFDWTGSIEKFLIIGEILQVIVELAALSSRRVDMAVECSRVIV